MLNRPDAVTLLEAARETLIESVLPRLDGESRYQTLMIANAIAIAVRELQQSAAIERAELDALTAMLGRESDPSAPDDSRDALRRLNRHLADQLRAGALDWRHPDVRAVLRRQIEARLTVDNPRFLQRARRFPLEDSGDA